MPKPKDWDQWSRRVMTDCVQAKFEQNDNLKTALLATDSRTFIECTKDTHWGSGSTFLELVADPGRTISGKNIMGRKLEETRAELNSQA